MIFEKAISIYYLRKKRARLRYIMFCISGIFLSCGTTLFELRFVIRDIFILFTLPAVVIHSFVVRIAFKKGSSFKRTTVHIIDTYLFVESVGRRQMWI